MMIETTRNLSPELTLPVPLDVRPGGVFWRALRDNIPGILSWGIGYGALLVAVVFLYPALQSNDTLMGIVRSLGLMGVASSSGIPLDALADFSGYIALEGLSWAPLILSLYLVPQSVGALLREEERGTLDILLSTPIPRWRLLSEKMLAILVSLLCILAQMWLALVVSTGLVVEIDFPVFYATTGIWHILPISLVIASFGLLVSVSVRSSRHASGWVSLALILSYFLRTISDLLYQVEWLAALRQISIFAHYRVIAALSSGFQPAQELGLLLVAAVLFLLALWQFQRRDIGA